MRLMRLCRESRSRGQSTTELALVLPILLILLLGAVDYAQVLSTEQHLENAAYVAALRLVTTPSLNSPARLSAYVQGESGLAPVSAASSYSVSGDGADQVVVTATYNYPLLLPGLRKLQMGPLSNGTFQLSVSAASIATTSAPVVTDSNGVLTVAPPSDGTVPASLALTCTLYENGVKKASGACRSGSSFQWTNPSPGGSNPYTATVTQANGMTSAPSTPATGP